MKNARTEMEYWNRYDYVILNDELESAAARFTALIESQRLAVKRMKESPFYE